MKHNYRKISGRMIAILSVLATLNASAVIVSGERNTTGEGAGDGWDYVGGIGAASGVFLGQYGGDYWVMTAQHVGAHDFTLNGTTYTPVAGSAKQVGGVDMIMYKINVAEGDVLSTYKNLTFSEGDSCIGIGSEVVMIGYGGAGQDANSTSWKVDTSTNPDTWATGENATGTLDREGYYYTGGHTKSWGTNLVLDMQCEHEEQPGWYLRVAFDDREGDAQGVVGDSGGGMFFYNHETDTWELAGIMDLVTKYNGQPGNAVVYGNATYGVPIINHIDEIYSILGITRAIPEPASTALFALGGMLAAFRRRRAA